MTDEREGLPSASELHIIVACPGYLQAKASAPPPTETKESDSSFGEEVHALAAGELDEMGAAERVSFVAQLCLKLIDRVTREVYGTPTPEGIMIWKETRWWLRDLDNKKIFSGRADRAVADKSGRWLVTDNKSLPGQVSPAADNWQILGLAACMADDSAMRGDYEITQLFGAIIQPLVTRSPQLVTYNPGQLKVATYQIRRSLEVARLPHAPRIPGPHCRYCVARPECPAAISMPMVLTQALPTPAPGEKPLPAKQQAELAVASLRPDQIEELLPKLPLITAIAEAVRENAKRLAGEGKLTHYELKEIQGRLAITSLKAARETLEPYVTPAEFNALLSVPVEALREIFVTRFAGINHTTKVAGGEKFSELIAPASQRSPATKRLAIKKEKET